MKIELRTETVPSYKWDIECDDCLCVWHEQFATDSLDDIQSWNTKEIEGLTIIGINYADCIRTVSMFRANKQPSIITADGGLRNYGFLIKIRIKVQNPLCPISISEETGHN